MNKKVRSILAQLRGALEALYGDRLDELVLFGSHARGDADPGSDIDVLVILKGEARAADEIGRVGDILADLSLETDTVVSCTFVSSERFINENSPLLLNARREGVGV